MTQKIIPNLWFDSHAEEAARFYTSLFEHSSIDNIVHYGNAGYEMHGQPAGKVMTVDFSIAGYQLLALNGGPHFQFTPAISLFVTCTTKDEIDRLWEELIRGGGSPLMEIGNYGFSERYGWIRDRFGLTWQLNYGWVSDAGQKIVPSFMFIGEQYGRGLEALHQWTGIFPDSSIDRVIERVDNEQPSGQPAATDSHAAPNTFEHATFTLFGEKFMAIESREHNFQFNEAVSLAVMCENQQEIDHYWNALSEGGDPAAQMCGWLKDRFGVSWQIVPTELIEMIRISDTERRDRITNAYMKMKKFDLEKLRQMYRVDIALS